MEKKKKSRVNKYILVKLQVKEENDKNCRQKKRRIAQKNCMMGINYELFDIYIYIHTHTHTTLKNFICTKSLKLILIEKNFIK